jgi:translocation and assembly module TamB
MRWRRWLVRIAVGLVAVVGLLLVAGWFLLRSSLVTNQVAARIQQATGAPVRVGAASVGLRGTSLSALQFLEDGAPEGSPPWATIPDVESDLSIAQLARGELSGGTVVLRNATVTLRLDRDDKLVTKIPPIEGGKMALPVFRVEDAQIVFQREGRPDTVFQKISGVIRSDPDTYHITGAADDPEWGHWALSGERERNNGNTSLQAHCDTVHVTPDKLRSIPFVPAVTWEHVRAAGNTPVDAQFRIGSSDPAPHYRIVLEPAGPHVEVAAIDLAADDVRGKIEVEDGVVNLQGLHGRAAGGELAVSGPLDFRGDASDTKFDITATKLALDKLPASWRMPLKTGTMSGRANLRVVVKNHQVQTEGEGKGTIEGFLSGPPLQVKLLAVNGGYRFDISNTPGARGPNPLAGLFAVTLVGLQPPVVAPALPVNPPAKGPVFNDIEINLGLKDVDLAELVQRLNVTVPFKLAGRLTFQVHAHIPMNNARDLKAYRFNGTVELPWVKLEDLELRQVKGRAVYESGVLRLEELSARVPKGDSRSAERPTLSGTASIGLVPPAELSAKLQLDQLPIGQVLRAIPNANADGGGTASGELTARAPTEAVRDLTKWDATGRLDARDVRAFGRSADEMSFHMRLERGTLAITDARGRVQGGAIGGNGQLEVTAPFRYEARLDLPPSDPKSWQQVAPELRSVRLAGQVRADSRVSGTLQPLTVKADGTARVDGVAINDFKLGTLHTRFDLDTERVRLTDLHAELYGGELVGTASLPLRSNVAGQVDLELKKLDTTHLTKDVPQTPIRLEGDAEGSIHGAIPPAPPGRDREITADVQLRAERLRVQNILAERLRANVTYRGGRADIKVQGQTLGGTFDFSTQFPPPPAGAAPAPPTPPQQGERGEGRLRIRGIDLSRLADTFRVPALRPLDGRFSLTADFRFTGPGGEAAGTGEVELTDLSWDDEPILNTLRGDVRISGGEVRLSDLNALVAGGSLRALVAYNYRDPRRSFLNLTLDRAEARSLLGPFMENPPLDGPVDVRLRGLLGSEWYGTADVAVGRGKLFGVTINDARFPLSWSITRGLNGRIRLTDASAQASMGRLTAKGEFTWGGENQLNGLVQFTNIDMGELLSRYSDRQVLGGRATGRATLGGRNLRSASEITAAVEATLGQAQASQLPVFRQLTPFILPGRSSNAWFRSGELRGHLAGGVFRIERLTLVGDAASVYADGTVTLQERLNLDVVANTRQLGYDPAALRLLRLSIPAVGPIPLAAINQASSYLSNRTIRLRVTGTIAAPSIQVNAARLLTESAVRFFLNQSPVPIPSVPGVGIP